MVGGLIHTCGLGSKRWHKLILHSLYPDNPFNFLVSLGTIRVLDMIEPKSEWELRWNTNAEIRCKDGKEPTEEEISDLLAEHLGKDDPLFEPQDIDYGGIMKGKNKKDSKSTKANKYDQYNEFMGFIMDLIMNKIDSNNFSSKRRLYDFAASVAFPDKEEIKDSLFRFVTGNATLFGNANKLVGEIERKKEGIHTTLFKEWDYLDDGVSMYWDPISLLREHALLIFDPVPSFNPSMHGANRLAVEAISLYPTLYDGKHVRTIGWNDKKFVWPIWEEFAGLDEIRGILSTDYSKFKPEELDKIGLELYSSERITKDKQMRFTKGTKEV